MRSAGILHADLDCFYAAVEVRDDPTLRGRPVVVGGGVVLTASYEARARGVFTAMPVGRAVALCPDAVVVAPRMDAYAAASRAVFAVFEDTTPLVEGLSVDEAFLDVSGLTRVAGSPVEIAARLRTRVADEVGLPITVGVARTKFLAKVASGVAKPDGLLVVDPDEEDAFLRPLDVQRLWGVGPVTAGRLRSRGLSTVGDVADLGEPALVALLGPAAGRHIHALSVNRDPRAVTPGKRRASVGAQQALHGGAVDLARLDRVLLGLVDRVGERLRADGRTGRTVTLRLRTGDFARLARSRTLSEPTDRTDVVLRVARDLLAERAGHLVDAGCTLIGVAVSDLAPADAVQLSLELDGPDRGHLDDVLDAVNGRFGPGAVTRASLLGRARRP